MWLLRCPTRQRGKCSRVSERKRIERAYQITFSWNAKPRHSVANRLHASVGVSEDQLASRTTLDRLGNHVRFTATCRRNDQPTAARRYVLRKRVSHKSIS